MPTISTSSQVIPWYRQFWPWFIIALPTVAVIASIATVVIAFTKADSLVNDNYYKDGLAINQQLAQDHTAQQLGLQAAIRLDLTSGELLLDLSGDLNLPEQLEMLLIHPVDASLDYRLTLNHVAASRYRTDLPRLLPIRYHLRLQPVHGGDWRLNGSLDIKENNHIIVSANE